MGEINIANSAGRDAVVAAQSVRSSRQVRWLDGQGRQAHTVRLLKAPIDRDAGALEGCDGGLGKVSDAIIALRVTPRWSTCTPPSASVTRWAAYSPPTGTRLRC